MRCLLAFLCLWCALPILAQSANPVLPRQSPPTIAPFDQVETLRLRVQNIVAGAVQVSSDQGKTWRLVGRVTAPATDNVTGYLASGYAQPGKVAATAVHGIRIRVGGLGNAYPKIISIIPREFAQTPKLFGGLVAGVSGIYTDIPTGTSIFRELSPYVGNTVYLELSSGLAPLPDDYSPRPGDTLDIIVQRPANPLREVVFENKTGGNVTATYADGTTQVVTTVLKPVLGVGRFDGTSYTGVGALNTNHTGVITVSTAPVTTSHLFEGDGPERRGGFQIEPVFHNSQTPEAGAPQVLIVGSPDKRRVPDLEGTPPLFDGYFDLAWLPGDLKHSWLAEAKLRGSDSWQMMPTAIGNLPNALQNVTAIRLIRNATDNQSWRIGRIASASQTYQQASRALAQAGKMPVERGRVTINAVANDPKTKYVAFYVDGSFEGLTNSAPYSFLWNTREVPDGEYMMEARAEDDNNTVLSVTRTKVWVDNARAMVRK